MLLKTMLLFNSCSGSLFHSAVICVLGSGPDPVSERCCVHGGAAGDRGDSLEEHSQEPGE